MRAGLVQLQTVHAFHAGIVAEILHREQQGCLFPAAGDPVTESGDEAVGAHRHGWGPP